MEQMNDHEHLTSEDLKEEGCGLFEGIISTSTSRHLQKSQ
jgi:hypothetical protein